MRICAVENLLIHNFSSEAILLDLNEEAYYLFNGVGLEMWQALMRCDSVESACDFLATQYDVPRQTLQSDLHEFISQLNALKLIEIHE